MASKKSAAAGGVQIPDMPKGFMDLSKRECDGFARPEAGLVIQGKIVGDYSYENDNGHQEVAQVELSEPCMAVVDKELVQLNKGQVIGVNVTPGLRELRDYFDARPNVYLVCHAAGIGVVIPRFRRCPCRLPSGIFCGIRPACT
jgi:hypothetical protein